MQPLTEEELEGILAGFFAGRYHVNQLPRETYERTLDALTEALLKGMSQGDALAEYKYPDLANAFKLNAATFSAAKEYHKAKALTDMLTTSDGAFRPYSDFKRDAVALLGEFDMRYLETEYRTAQRVAQAGVTWKKIEQQISILPFLRYQTVGDDAVRDEHAELDNVIYRVDDPIWSSIYPPNGWNCRCIVEQLDRDEALAEDPLANDRAYINIEDHVDPAFRFNAGKEGQLFPASHPYFIVDPKDKAAAANNFGLPVPPPSAPTLTPEKLAELTEDVRNKILALKRSEEAKELNVIDRKLARKQEQSANGLLKSRFIRAKGWTAYYKMEEEQTKIISALIDERDLAGLNLAKKVSTAYPAGKAKFNVTSVNSKGNPISKKMQKRADEALDVFRRMVGRRADLDNETYAMVFGKTDRAYYDESEKAGYYKAKETPGTIAHEAGHWLEFRDLGFQKETYEWVRGRGSSFSDNTRTRNQEIGPNSPWLNSYSGKLYKQGCTEAVSMYFSHMLEDPFNFIAKDPEHFNRITSYLIEKNYNK